MGNIKCKECKFCQGIKRDIMKIISDCYNTLYSLKGCSCGGLGHAVFDDNNIDDEDLDCTIQWCQEPENEDRPEKDLVIFMCNQMKKLTLEERKYLYTLMWIDWDFDAFYCLDDNCEDCMVTTNMKVYFNESEKSVTSNSNPNNLPVSEDGKLYAYSVKVGETSDTAGNTIDIIEYHCKYCDEEVNKPGEDGLICPRCKQKLFYKEKE